jgi:hypothetical protein
MGTAKRRSKRRWATSNPRACAGHLLGIRVNLTVAKSSVAASLDRSVASEAVHRDSEIHAAMHRLLPRWLVATVRDGRSAGPAGSGDAANGASGSGSRGGAAAALKWAVPAALAAGGLYVAYRVGRGLYVFFTADPAAGIEHSCIPTDEDEWDHRWGSGGEGVEGWGTRDGGSGLG